MKIAFIYCHHSLSHCGDQRICLIAEYTELQCRWILRALSISWNLGFAKYSLHRTFSIYLVYWLYDCIQKIWWNFPHPFDACSFRCLRFSDRHFSPNIRVRDFAATKNILQEKNVRAPCTVTLLWGLGGAPHKQLGWFEWFCLGKIV